MISLLDVNVLVALAWPNHVHHAAAQHWLGPALKRGGRLATFDRDIRAIVPKGFDADQVVAIIR